MKTFTAKKIFSVHIKSIGSMRVISVLNECLHCSIAFVHITQSTILFPTQIIYYSNNTIILIISLLEL